jgi:hypothetical protein
MRVDLVMFFSSLDHYKKKLKVLSSENKMAEKFKMTSTHESGRTIKFKNIVEVTFFPNSKWKKIQDGRTVLYFVLYLSQFFTVFKM